MALDRSTFNLSQDLADSFSDKLVQLITEWITKHRMSHDPNTSEIGIFPNPLGTVNDLIWNDEISRCNIFS